MANTAYVSIHDCRWGGRVPNAAGQAVVRFSAVALTPAGVPVAPPGGVPEVTDVANVAISGGDTLATLQARVTAAVQSLYGDPALQTVFV